MSKENPRFIILAKVPFPCFHEPNLVIPIRFDKREVLYPDDITTRSNGDTIESYMGEMNRVTIMGQEDISVARGSIINVHCNVLNAFSKTALSFAISILSFSILVFLLFRILRPSL